MHSQRGTPIAWLSVTILLFSLLAGLAASTNAASPPYFRLSQLSAAQAKAKAESKPIVWIGSFPGSMTPNKNPMGTSSHAATYHAYLTFYRDAVIVWSDADSENHQEPSIVDSALHSPNAHYTAPGIIVLTPELDKVIGKVFYIKDGKARTAAYGELLKKIRDKKSWNNSAP